MTDKVLPEYILNGVASYRWVKSSIPDGLGVKYGEDATCTTNSPCATNYCSTGDCPSVVRPFYVLTENGGVYLTNPDGSIYYLAPDALRMRLVYPVNQVKEKTEKAAPYHSTGSSIQVGNSAIRYDLNITDSVVDIVVKPTLTRVIPWRPGTSACMVVAGRDSTRYESITITGRSDEHRRMTPKGNGGNIRGGLVQPFSNGYYCVQTDQFRCVVFYNGTIIYDGYYSGMGTPAPFTYAESCCTVGENGCCPTRSTSITWHYDVFPKWKMDSKGKYETESLLDRYLDTLTTATDLTSNGGKFLNVIKRNVSHNEGEEEKFISYSPVSVYYLSDEYGKETIDDEEYNFAIVKLSSGEKVGYAVVQKETEGSVLKGTITKVTTKKKDGDEENSELLSTLENDFVSKRVAWSFLYGKAYCDLEDDEKTFTVKFDCEYEGIFKCTYEETTTMCPEGKRGGIPGRHFWYSGTGYIEDGPNAEIWVSRWRNQMCASCDTSEEGNDCGCKINGNTGREFNIYTTDNNCKFQNPDTAKICGKCNYPVTFPDGQEPVWKHNESCEKRSEEDKAQYKETYFCKGKVAKVRLAKLGGRIESIYYHDNSESDWAYIMCGESDCRTKKDYTIIGAVDDKQGVSSTATYLPGYYHMAGNDEDGEEGEYRFSPSAAQAVILRAPSKYEEDNTDTCSIGFAKGDSYTIRRVSSSQKETLDEQLSDLKEILAEDLTGNYVCCATDTTVCTKPKAGGTGTVIVFAHVEWKQDAPPEQTTTITTETWKSADGEVLKTINTKTVEVVEKGSFEVTDDSDPSATTFTKTYIRDENEYTGAVTYKSMWRKLTDEDVRDNNGNKQFRTKDDNGNETWRMMVFACRDLPQEGLSGDIGLSNESNLEAVLFSHDYDGQNNTDVTFQIKPSAETGSTEAYTQTIECITTVTKTKKTKTDNNGKKSETTVKEEITISRLVTFDSLSFQMDRLPPEPVVADEVPGVLEKFLYPTPLLEDGKYVEAPNNTIKVDESVSVKKTTTTVEETEEVPSGDTSETEEESVLDAIEIRKHLFRFFPAYLTFPGYIPPINDGAPDYDREWTKNVVSDGCSESNRKPDINATSCTKTKITDELGVDDSFYCVGKPDRNPPSEITKDWEFEGFVQLGENSSRWAAKWVHYEEETEKEKTVRLLRQGVDSNGFSEGSEEAQYFLGRCHYFGYGVDKNEEEGLELINASAEGDYQRAKRFLAVLNGEEPGVLNTEEDDVYLKRLVRELEDTYGKQGAPKDESTVELPRPQGVCDPKSYRLLTDIVRPVGGTWYCLGPMQTEKKAFDNYGGSEQAAEYDPETSGVKWVQAAFVWGDPDGIGVRVGTQVGDIYYKLGEREDTPDYEDGAEKPDVTLESFSKDSDRFWYWSGYAWEDGNTYLSDVDGERVIFYKDLGDINIGVQDYESEEDIKEEVEGEDNEEDDEGTEEKSDPTKSIQGTDAKNECDYSRAIFVGKVRTTQPCGDILAVNLNPGDSSYHSAVFYQNKPVWDRPAYSAPVYPNQIEFLRCAGSAYTLLTYNTGENKQMFRIWYHPYGVETLTPKSTWAQEFNYDEMPDVGLIRNTGALSPSDVAKYGAENIAKTYLTIVSRNRKKLYLFYKGKLLKTYVYPDDFMRGIQEEIDEQTAAGFHLEDFVDRWPDLEAYFGDVQKWMNGVSGPKFCVVRKKRGTVEVDTAWGRSFGELATKLPEKGGYSYYELWNEGESLGEKLCLIYLGGAFIEMSLYPDEDRRGSDVGPGLQASLLCSVSTGQTFVLTKGDGSGSGGGSESMCHPKTLERWGLPEGYWSFSSPVWDATVAELLKTGSSKPYSATDEHVYLVADTEGVTSTIQKTPRYESYSEGEYDVDDVVVYGSTLFRANRNTGTGGIQGGRSSNNRPIFFPDDLEIFKRENRHIAEYNPNMGKCWDEVTDISPAEAAVRYFCVRYNKHTEGVTVEPVDISSYRGFQVANYERGATIPHIRYSYTQDLLVHHPCIKSIHNSVESMAFCNPSDGALSSNGVNMVYVRVLPNVTLFVYYAATRTYHFIDLSYVLPASDKSHVQRWWYAKVLSELCGTGGDYEYSQLATTLVSGSDIPLITLAGLFNGSTRDSLFSDGGYTADMIETRFVQDGDMIRDQPHNSDDHPLCGTWTSYTVYGRPTQKYSYSLSTGDRTYSFATGKMEFGSLDNNKLDRSFYECSGCVYKQNSSPADTLRFSAGFRGEYTVILHGWDDIQKAIQVDDEFPDYQKSIVADFSHATHYENSCSCHAIVKTPEALLYAPGFNTPIYTIELSGVTVSGGGDGFACPPNSISYLYSNSDIPDYEASTTYSVGTVIKGPASSKCFVCTQEVSGVSPDVSDGEDYWEEYECTGVAYHKPGCGDTDTYCHTAKYRCGSFFVYENTINKSCSVDTVEDRKSATVKVYSLYFMGTRLPWSMVFADFTYTRNGVLGAQYDKKSYITAKVVSLSDPCAPLEHPCAASDLNPVSVAGGTPPIGDVCLDGDEPSTVFLSCCRAFLDKNPDTDSSNLANYAITIDGTVWYRDKKVTKINGTPEELRAIEASCCGDGYLIRITKNGVRYALLLIEGSPVYPFTSSKDGSSSDMVWRKEPDGARYSLKCCGYDYYLLKLKAITVTEPGVVHKFYQNDEDGSFGYQIQEGAFRYLEDGSKAVVFDYVTRSDSYAVQDGDDCKNITRTFDEPTVWEVATPSSTFNETTKKWENLSGFRFDSDKTYSFIPNSECDRANGDDFADHVIVEETVRYVPWQRFIDLKNCDTFVYYREKVISTDPRIESIACFRHRNIYAGEASHTPEYHATAAYAIFYDNPRDNCPRFDQEYDISKPESGCECDQGTSDDAAAGQAQRFWTWKYECTAVQNVLGVKQTGKGYDASARILYDSSTVGMDDTEKPVCCYKHEANGGSESPKTGSEEFDSFCATKGKIKESQKNTCIIVWSRDVCQTRTRYSDGSPIKDFHKSDKPFVPFWDGKTGSSDTATYGSIEEASDGKTIEELRDDVLYINDYNAAGRWDRVSGDDPVDEWESDDRSFQSNRICAGVGGLCTSAPAYHDQKDPDNKPLDVRGRLIVSGNNMLYVFDGLTGRSDFNILSGERIVYRHN